MTTRLQAIADRLARATPGPWRADTAQRGDCVVWGPNEDQFLLNIGNVVSRVVLDGQDEAEAERIAFDMEEANCELIAHAPSDLAWCIARIERLEALLLEAHESGTTETWYDDVSAALEDRNGRP
jgi:hypothetical protein